MKNLLALVGLAVVLVAGSGWYLGWYKLASEPIGDGHSRITVDVNGKKITQDLKKGEEKVEGFLNKGTTPTPGSSATMITPSGRSVDGTPTGLQVNQDGSFTIIPPKIEIRPGN